MLGQTINASQLSASARGNKDSEQDERPSVTDEKISQQDASLLGAH
jgi:hypothetical protein